MPEEQQDYESIEMTDLMLKRTRKVQVPLGDGLGITVSWNPDRITPAVYAKMQELFDKETKDPFVIAEGYIVPFMTEWSLTEKGKPYPITVENVASLNLVICKAIAEAINADFQKVTNPKEIADTKDGSGAS